MTDMSPDALRGLADADRHGIDTEVLLHVDELPEDEAIRVIDEVFGEIHFD
ncbi:hypothetical protein [Spongiactinospora sp. TRM90649]|uniref:hypothetical protein n=1 Tax=Spongiactinospora sp. TRM90649 TaxID=3031114 RepID=UPI0023F8B462|nr:hypothetical protein [Spongiactinospora sp. TRM90649]MDF5756550.1 hypothetical protein [Spongiactinospora sp. TRM90649]